jgi:hypothetical protein
MECLLNAAGGVDIAILNGVLACCHSGPLMHGLGDGAGIAAFYRSGADASVFGFQSLKIEPL